MRSKRAASLGRPYIAAGAGFFLCLMFGAYSYGKVLRKDELTAKLGVLDTATIIEAYFQMLPEEQPAKEALKIPIFIYHSVRPISPDDSFQVRSYEISPELFEQQLKYLEDNGYTAITMDEVAKDLQTGTTSPTEKPVVLTFDDGWENQYTYAFPLLKKYHMTATFYVFTSAIGTKHWFTWDQLREMQAAGMHIEDHTIDHPRFGGLPLDKVRTEVTKSKSTLEAKLGVPINHFASPFGYSNADIINIVKDAGYATYRTTYKGVYQDNPLHLRGILVTNDIAYFKQELNR